ncbi:uncharacterized protein LOC108477476 [Gossypium arboreum]|uniref:uncharacterized protein LOC108477476 n=1 Tax=Gossypium arboreum TaxID=29729 RepID=UPI00081921D7|nr:uncharacterized protein LOC108477476 [Gossypium arboreum]
MSHRALKNQVGKTANTLNSRPQGTLLSDTEILRIQGKEQCKATTLRSGTKLDEVVQDAMTEEDKSNCNHEKISEPTERQKAPEKGTHRNVVIKSDHVANKNVTQNNIGNLKDDHLYIFLRDIKMLNRKIQFKRFLDVLKQLYINIPLVETLEQMPNYVKFIKYILSKSHRLGEFETTALTEGCTAMLMNKLAPKLKDPGSFTILCSIGNHYVGEDKVSDVEPVAMNPANEKNAPKH